MARRSKTIGMALLFGFITGVATADARTAAPRAPAEPAAPSRKERPIQWKLWIGKKAYTPSPKGGSIVLPKGTEWKCRYSATAETSKRNLKEETVSLTCSAGSAEFGTSTTCSYPVDPHKQVEEGVMPSEYQHAVLGGRILVGLSCEVPGFELRTYRKK